jgi:polyhydroxyalkanoate synthesis regulator protein
MDQPGQPALLERYAGQRLYRPATSTYLTRGDLITMAKNGEKFVVIDAHIHDDVTSLVSPHHRRASKAMPRPEEPIVIRKYPNRRLYNTGIGADVILEDLADMVRQGEDFVVYDAKSGEDITRSVLTQIIFTQTVPTH